MHGRSALKVGIIKRVGDGYTIRPWADPWIPSNISRLPLVSNIGPPIESVQELIDTHTDDWNVEEVKKHFIQPDVQAICNIPPGHDVEDTWAWSLERSRQFSARSAYRALIAEQRQGDSPSSSGGGESRAHWKKL